MSTAGKAVPYSPIKENIGFLIGLIALGAAAFVAGSVFPGYVPVFTFAFAMVTLLLLSRWPSFGIVLLYPVTWIVGAYNITWLGGRVERLVAVVGLIGVIFLMRDRWRGLIRVPPMIKIGLTLLVGGYFVSWVLRPDSPQAPELVVSLISRVVFLLLVVVHIRSEQDIKIATMAFIASSFVCALLTLYIGVEYGFGYIRDYEMTKTVMAEVEPLLVTISRNGNQVTAAAILLLGLYPWIREPKARLWLWIGVLFLFWMAFAAEFRRELLLTVPVVLSFLYLDKRSGLSKVALPMLIVCIFLFFFLLLPTSDILQMRFEQETSSVVERREARMVSTIYGFQAFLEAPIVGHGPGSYMGAVFPKIPFDMHYMGSRPFNVFIWAAVESGLIALTGICLILLGSWMSARRLSRSRFRHFDMIVRLGPLFVVLIIIWFTFGNSWENSAPWFLIGLILAAAKIQYGDRQPSLSSRRSWKPRRFRRAM